ncbi:MAG TPA: PqqD family protein [Acholeplasmataceae bacterium]|nr:MAG: pyrroloquinoline quinone biosynthesis protein [Tenericutes bacterium GWA2_38_26]HBY65435.1 PqqD family protein [Acholeplasmataceae bacterium]HCB66296.1 PqqD family protein [Acholeplasmataceae bacterium]
MKIKKGFILKSVSDKFIVVPVGEEAVNFNGLMTLNKSGKLLFEALQQESTIESLTELVMEKYEIDQRTAELDVESFVKKLKDKQIIE